MPQVDNWVYDEANSTFIDDPDMQKRLMDANPNSFRKLVCGRVQSIALREHDLAPYSPLLSCKAALIGLPFGIVM